MKKVKSFFKTILLYDNKKKKNYSFTGKKFFKLGHPNQEMNSFCLFILLNFNSLVDYKHFYKN